MTASVVVIGDALLDIRIVPSEPPRRGSDVPARIELAPGGQGANVAVRLARRGMAVELVSAVAADLAGAMIRSSLEADGVALRAIEVPRTGAVVVLAEPHGERTMLSQRVPFGHRVAARAAGSTSWLVVSGYVLAEPGSFRLAGDAAAWSGRRVLLGCALSTAAVAAWLEAARALRPDLVILNEGEMERLGTTDGLGMVAITAADRATLLTAGGGSVVVDVPPGPAAVDTTGAGDAFAAGLLASLAAAAWPPSNAELRRAVADGIALAGLVARVDGAQARVATEPRSGMPA